MCLEKFEQKTLINFNNDDDDDVDSVYMSWLRAISGQKNGDDD